MSKHSPGPWKVQRRLDCMHCIEVTGSVLNERGEIQSRIELLPDDPADRHCHFIDAGGDDVITVNAGPQDELLIDPADARLIAAAPEMLELLQEAALACLCHLGVPGERCWNCRRVDLLARLDD